MHMTCAPDPVSLLAAPDLPRPRVVIADNDPMIRGVLRSMLARLGLDLVATPDGQGALAAATEEARLFLLDLDMPGGGLGVCRTLRAAPAFRDVPIAILTGHHDDDLRRQCLAEGATLFLTKPFNPAQLLVALAPHLPLDEHGRSELMRLVEFDRGLHLQDVAASRLPGSAC